MNDQNDRAELVAEIDGIMNHIRFDQKIRRGVVIDILKRAREMLKSQNEAR